MAACRTRSIRVPEELRGRRRRRTGADRRRRRRLPSSLPAARQRRAAPPRTSLPCGARRRRAPRTARRGVEGRQRGRHGAAERQSGLPREKDGRGGGAAPGNSRTPIRPRPGAPRRRSAGKRADTAGRQRWDGASAPAAAGMLRSPAGERCPGEGAVCGTAAVRLLPRLQVALAGTRNSCLARSVAETQPHSCAFRAKVRGSRREAGCAACWKGESPLPKLDTTKLRRVSEEWLSSSLGEEALYKTYKGVPCGCVSQAGTSLWVHSAELGCVTSFILDAVYIL